MKRLLNMRNKKGNIALEAVLAGGALFMVFVLLIGYFTYLYPRYMVDLEVQNLAHAVKMDGKLTESDFQVFIDNMENRGYTEDEVRKGTNIVATNVTNVLDDDPLRAKNEDVLIDRPGMPAKVVERNNGQMDITVSVPANTAYLGGSMKWFGGGLNDDMKYYTVKRTIMSEAYLPKGVGE